MASLSPYSLLLQQQLMQAAFTQAAKTQTSQQNLLQYQKVISQETWISFKLYITSRD